MLPAMIALVATYIPSHIHVMLKHPMLVAIKIWALAHLLANGDLASLVLFGSFLAFAVYDRISVKKRGDLGPLGRGSGPWINDRRRRRARRRALRRHRALPAPADHRRLAARMKRTPDRHCVAAKRLAPMQTVDSIEISLEAGSWATTRAPNTSGAR